MARYIDANKLEELCDIMADKCDGMGISIWNQFKTMVEMSPTVDAVPVVRCKDCKNFKRDIPCVGGTYNGCGQLEGRDGCEPYVEEDFFCAYGERRTDE